MTLAREAPAWTPANPAPPWGRPNSSPGSAFPFPRERCSGDARLHPGLLGIPGSCQVLVLIPGRRNRPPGSAEWFWRHEGKLLVFIPILILIPTVIHLSIAMSSGPAHSLHVESPSAHFRAPGYGLHLFFFESVSWGCSPASVSCFPGIWLAFPHAKVKVLLWEQVPQ